MSKISINMSKGVLRPAEATTSEDADNISTDNTPAADAQQLSDATEQFIINHFSLLSPQEIATTYKHIQQLKDAITTKDNSKIQEAKIALEGITMPIITKVTTTPNP